MTATPKILFLAGSARRESLNKKLAKAAAGLAADAGIEAVFIDLKDYEMPLYDGDLETEKGSPEGARRLREQFMQADGFFIASPEYNSSVSPLLKNAIDWVSRADGDIPGLIAFKGKVAGLVGASPGGLGGLRGLVHLRSILGNIGVLVTPTQHALGAAHEAFDEQGNIKSDKQVAAVRNVIEELARTARALKGA